MTIRAVTDEAKTQGKRTGLLERLLLNREHILVESKHATVRSRERDRTVNA